MPCFAAQHVSVCAVGHKHLLAAREIVSIGYKASAFDNARKVALREKPLRDKDLTASIEVNS